MLHRRLSLDSPFTLDAVLADAHRLLRSLGMRTLAEGVRVARRTITRLEDRANEDGGKLAPPRVAIRKDDGLRNTWWALPLPTREHALRFIEQHLPDAVSPLDDEAERAIALHAARALLLPDWRTSLQQQIESILAHGTEDPSEQAELFAALDAIVAPHRPVFEADAIARRPRGLEIACEICGANPGHYCDPTKHPEVPGEG